jgi:hypothetical protein
MTDWHIEGEWFKNCNCGMEYTGPNNEAETALTKRLVAHGKIEFDLRDRHSSMALVHHGSDVDTAVFEPTVVERAFD